MEVRSALQRILLKQQTTEIVFLQLQSLFKGFWGVSTQV